jgi:ribonuclease BN (tRNA processing enzyme)
MRGRLAILFFALFALVASWFTIWATWRYQKLAQDIAWLEDRSFDTLTMLTIGTGSAYENPNRLGPVSAIGIGTRIALVDAGRGIAEALRRCHIRASQPEAVYLSSLLPENIVGLDDLLATGWLAAREVPLRLIGPPGTEELAAAILAAQAPGTDALAREVGLPRAGALLDVVEASDGWSETRDDGVTIRAGAVGARPLPSLAWRFETTADAARAALALVVAGSGPEPAALEAFSQGAGLLAVEGFFRASVDAVIEAGDPDAERLRREADLHLATGDVGRLAERADIPLLVLTRLRPPPMFDQQLKTAIQAHYRGRVVVAEDCDSFSGGGD